MGLRPKGDIHVAPVFTKAQADRFGEEAITGLIARIRPMGDVFSREIDARSAAGVARQVLGRKPIGSILNLPAPAF